MEIVIVTFDIYSIMTIQAKVLTFKKLSHCQTLNQINKNEAAAHDT